MNDNHVISEIFAEDLGNVSVTNHGMLMLHFTGRSLHPKMEDNEDASAVVKVRVVLPLHAIVECTNLLNGMLQKLEKEGVIKRVESSSNKSDDKVH